jgi:hypothetical protein
MLRDSRSPARRLASIDSTAAGRQPRPIAIAMVSPVPVNSHSVELPRVTRIPVRAEKVSDATISWARMLPVEKASGGQTTTLRSPSGRV